MHALTERDLQKILATASRLLWAAVSNKDEITCMRGGWLSCGRGVWLQARGPTGPTGPTWHVGTAQITHAWS